LSNPFQFGISVHPIYIILTSGTKFSADVETLTRAPSYGLHKFKKE